MKKVLKWLFYALSLFLIVFITNEKIPKIANKYYLWTYREANNIDSAEFEFLIRKASIDCIKNKRWDTPLVLLANSSSLLNYLRTSIPVFEYGEYGYLLHYSYLYGILNNDNEIKGLVKDMFDGQCLGKRITRNDQVTYGNVALDLYTETRDEKYKEYADAVYHRLDSLDAIDGVVLYNEGKKTEQRVDGIGLVCPFLFYYAKVMNNQSAKEIGDKMVGDYIKWGTDPETGIPAKAYGRDTHIKHISPNWGRGISWYLLGIIDSDSQDIVQKGRIDVLVNYLMADSDHLYSQYIDEDGLPDMSSTIPIIWFLNKKKGYLNIRYFND